MVITMGAFLSKLMELKDSKIVVVTTDGMAFRGVLVDLSEDMIVLHDIAETTNQEIEWVEEESVKKGYVIWRKVELPEVIIKMDAVSRIWPWKFPKKSVEKASKKGLSHKEVEDYIPIYRTSWISMG